MKLHDSAEIFFFVLQQKFHETRILKTASTGSSITPILNILLFFPYSSSNPSSTNNDTSFSAADRKLRPKSLAISTPTKLLSLEEARQRLGPNGSDFTSAQKYIEVGGGPKSLPQKYHTVIDLPSSQRRSMKKSPMGWKAIFKSKTNQKNGPKNRRIDLINQQVCHCCF